MSGSYQICHGKQFPMTISALHPMQNHVIMTSRYCFGFILQGKFLFIQITSYVDYELRSCVISNLALGFVFNHVKDAKMNKMLLSLCRGNKKFMFQVFTIKEKESFIEKKKQQKEKKLKYIDCACFNEYWCCEILRGPGQYISR